MIVKIIEGLISSSAAYIHIYIPQERGVYVCHGNADYFAIGSTSYFVQAKTLTQKVASGLLVSYAIPIKRKSWTNDGLMLAQCHNSWWCDDGRKSHTPLERTYCERQVT